MAENQNSKQGTICVFYDKGYCARKKIHYLQKHPSIDCDNKCSDRTTCPNWQRVVCKNEDSCVCIPSKSC